MYQQDLGVHYLKDCIDVFAENLKKKIRFLQKKSRKNVGHKKLS